MVREARLTLTEQGLVPRGEGWYVVNARESRWLGHDELGKFCHFEGDVRFPDLGINVCVLEPGQPNCMYHQENAQEDFLVLSGECLILIEGEKRPLRAWDFVHCPAWTQHSLVGAGSRPCVFVAVGGRCRPDEGRYTVADVALKHGAGVSEETSSPKKAYARFSPIAERPYPDGSLPER